MNRGIRWKLKSGMFFFKFIEHTKARNRQLMAITTKLNCVTFSIYHFAFSIINISIVVSIFLSSIAGNLIHFLFSIQLSSFEDSWINFRQRFLKYYSLKFSFSFCRYIRDKLTIFASSMEKDNIFTKIKTWSQISSAVKLFFTW